MANYGMKATLGSVEDYPTQTAVSKLTLLADSQEQLNRRFSQAVSCVYASLVRLDGMINLPEISEGKEPETVIDRLANNHNLTLYFVSQLEAMSEKLETL